MSLTEKDIKKIAHLARLHITEQDIPAYQTGLSRILGMIDQMNEVDTSTVEPLAHPGEEQLRLRPDCADAPADRERLQQVAPATERGLYLVPKVVD